MFLFDIDATEEIASKEMGSIAAEISNATIYAGNILKNLR